MKTIKIPVISGHLSLAVFPQPASDYKVMKFIKKIQILKSFINCFRTTALYFYIQTMMMHPQNLASMSFLNSNLPMPTASSPVL